MTADWLWHIAKRAAESKSKLIPKAGYFFLYRRSHLLGRMGMTTRVAFGKATITVPSNHACVLWSAYWPLMNWNLGRLAKAVPDNARDCSIVEVDANVGDTYAIIRASGVSNRIIAIEGDQASISWLRTNTASDMATPVWEGFVGNAGESLRFEGQRGATSGVVHRGTHCEDGLRMVPLDQIVQELDSPVVGLIKVDTDGFDTLVARSAEDVLRRNHPVLFLEIQPYHLMWNDGFDSFQSWLQSLEYDTALCWDNLGRFVCEVPTSERKLLRQLMVFFNGAPDMQFLDIGFSHTADSPLRSKAVEDDRSIVFSLRPSWICRYEAAALAI